MRFHQTARRSPGRPASATLFWWTLIRGIVRLVLGALYRLDMRGWRHIPSRGPIIYVSNHQSHYDPPIIGSLIYDRPFRAIARASLFNFRPFGLAMRGLGAIEIQRGEADTTAIKRALEALRAGDAVLIFPEGTRTPTGRTEAFKRGVALLIKRSGAPIVPIAVEGACDIWPVGRRLPRLTGRIAVMAGPALDTEVLFADGPDAALDQLRRLIEGMRLELRQYLRDRSRGQYPPPGPADLPYWDVEGP